VPGFSYTISKADVVRATLNAVSTKSQVRLLSSPSILVLNNHTANIQVGQQQPILTSTAAATGSNFITQSITYKDTGVLLSVTPSVNAGGLISMDISQQVTDVGERDVVTSQRSFQTRQIQTRVAVRSGESIVLGGLIRENDTNSRAGLPGLADVPLLGALFSNTKNDRNRTELLVLMTPRALEDDDQLRSASAEMRERMRSLSLQAQPMSFRPPDVQLQPSR
jgi:general secretion pathway protein D